MKQFLTYRFWHERLFYHLLTWKMEGKKKEREKKRRSKDLTQSFRLSTLLGGLCCFFHKARTFLLTGCRLTTTMTKEREIVVATSGSNQSNLQSKHGTKSEKDAKIRSPKQRRITRTRNSWLCKALKSVEEKDIWAHIPKTSECWKRSESLNERMRNIDPTLLKSG